MDGAVNSIETSTVLPGSVSGMGEEPGVSMRSPATQEMVYPLHLHLPLFMKCHVLVNFMPRDMRALSGTVTSSTITALSLQEFATDCVPAVPFGVPGVIVVETSAVEVGRTSVGSFYPDSVTSKIYTLSLHDAPDRRG